MLCGLLSMQQAAICNCLSFDPFYFDQNGLASPEVDVGGRQVADALMIAQMIVVGDKGLDLGFEIERQNQQNPARCQPMTVSGLTITKAFRMSGASR
jgi:hypothetical protein